MKHLGNVVAKVRTPFDNLGCGCERGLAELIRDYGEWESAISCQRSTFLKVEAFLLTSFMISHVEIEICIFLN